MDKKIKIYNATLPEDAIGLYTISLVDDPAFETEWVAFSKDNPKKEGKRTYLRCIFKGRYKRNVTEVHKERF